MNPRMMGGIQEESTPLGKGSKIIEEDLTL